MRYASRRVEGTHSPPTSKALLTQQRDALFNKLKAFARDQGFAIEMTPAGMVTVPLSQGKPLSDEEFQQLPAELLQELEHRNTALQDRLADTLRQVRQMQKEATERVRQLDRDVALFTVGPHLDELREAYTDQPEVLDYLDQVKRDLPEHLDDFRSGEGEPQVFLSRLQGLQREENLARYRVNVFVDNDGLVGAPVIVELNPTYYNLIAASTIAPPSAPWSPNSTRSSRERSSGPTAVSSSCRCSMSCVPFRLGCPQALAHLR